MVLPSAVKKKIKNARNFLFKMVNKEFFVFLFFLAVSAGFWVVMALNENYEKEVHVALKITKIPGNVVITDPPSDTIKVTLRDKGYNLLPYIYGDAIQPLHISFSSYAKANCKGSIPATDIQRMMYGMLYGNTKIVSVKAEKLDFSYNFGLSKRVPVLIDGAIKPADTYYIAAQVVKPDSVTIYSSQYMLDSIKDIFTEELIINDLSDTLARKVALRKIPGVKIVPEQVRISVFADKLTETTVQVPIIPINMPQGQIIRTFPTKVMVKVVVGRNRLPFIKPENFRVVVDYKEVANNPSDKISLKLKVVPKGITKATLESAQVDYLIESTY